ncbi:ATP-binding protein [Streptomyces sp. NPDC090301]|uniref:ATP-binding protein n=1 Tax=Streptomyces sp. NPDC090301 TaxID=3154975 RepID=UPI0034481D12
MTTPDLAETEPPEIGTLSLIGKPDWGIEVGISAPGFAAHVITPDVEDLRRIRDFARDVLDEWGLARHSDVVIAVVEELVANAVQHAFPDGLRAEGRGDAWMGLLRKENAVICAVADPSPSPPSVAGLDPMGDAGRGMHIVAGLSAAWGYSPADPSGKTVWAKIPTPRQ